GKRLNFDSLLEVFRYRAKNPALNIADLYVSDYGDPADTDRARVRPWLPATAAFYVDGSVLKGPMGDPSLPACTSSDTANRLIQVVGGRILKFSDLTPAVTNRLTLR
ncbi:MAG TPA: nitrous oxide reductase accessory protein NosL, partial [Rhodocyclaceae bacterium]|nr:nitrous oxide reductase accessory protein NosL [Rhodocyclaceae bacterium]